MYCKLVQVSEYSVALVSLGNFVLKSPHNPTKGFTVDRLIPVPVWLSPWNRFAPSKDDDVNKDFQVENTPTEIFTKYGTFQRKP